MLFWLRCLTAVIGLMAAAPYALASCAGEMRIVATSPLTFGIVSTAREGGVVVVSPNGAVATLGGVGAGPGAHPGTIQFCGPPGAAFHLFLDTAEPEVAAGLGSRRRQTVRNLEILARGAELYPAAAGQWNGRLGPGGRADLRIGATLTIPPGQAPDSFVTPFRIAIVGSE